jgi:tetratricopeptide (TPR) repeat protein
VTVRGVDVVRRFAESVDPAWTILESERREYESGYKSWHLLVRYDPVHWPTLFGANDADEYLRNVPVEIQIRTILQDAWATVDHRAVYKAAQDAGRAVRRRFRLVSKQLEECDRYIQHVLDDMQRESFSPGIAESYNLSIEALGLEGAARATMEGLYPSACAARTDGNFERAIELHRQLAGDPAIATVAKAKNWLQDLRGEIALDYLEAARSAQRRGKHDEKMVFASLAVEKYHEVLRASEIGWFFPEWRIAQAYSILGDMESAIKHGRAALDEFDAKKISPFYGKPPHRGTILRRLAVFYTDRWRRQVQGTESDIAAAMHLTRESVRYFRDMAEAGSSNPEFDPERPA